MYVAMNNMEVYDCKSVNPQAVENSLCKRLPLDYPLFTPWNYRADPTAGLVDRIIDSILIDRSKKALILQPINPLVNQPVEHIIQTKGPLKGQFNCDDKCIVYHLQGTKETKITESSDFTKWFTVDIPEFSLGDKLKFSVENTAGPGGLAGEFTFMGKKYITDANTFKLSTDNNSYEAPNNSVLYTKNSPSWNQMIETDKLKYIWPHENAGYNGNILTAAGNEKGDLFFTGV